MNVIEILPELDIGGVERHVVDLSNKLAEMGHRVIVVSAGGRMRSHLSDKVGHRFLPAHKKNPLTVFMCAREISRWAKDEGWQIIHAHSRVPAFIAWTASGMAGIPWLYTAHACYSLNFGLIPLKHAGCVICVSETVRNHLKDYLPQSSKVILNALPRPDVSWAPDCGSDVRFLFVGRLTKIKGLDTVIRALGGLSCSNWKLDVVGDGPERDELEALSRSLGLGEKIVFHGYSDETDAFMARSSCLLFPSHAEGMPLTLVRAVQIGLPVIASRIPSVEAMAGTSEGLPPPGDTEAWMDAIEDFMISKRARTDIALSSIPSMDEMACAVENTYRELLRTRK